MAIEASANHMLCTRVASHFNLDASTSPTPHHGRQFPLNGFIIVGRFSGSILDITKNQFDFGCGQLKLKEERNLNSNNEVTGNGALSVFLKDPMGVTTNQKGVTEKAYLPGGRPKPSKLLLPLDFPPRVPWVLRVIEIVKSKNNRGLFQAGPSPKGLSRRASV